MLKRINVMCNFLIKFDNFLDKTPNIKKLFLH